MNEFFEQVYRVVDQIPYGRVAFYGQIARMLGKPHGSRAVGRAMRCCPEGLPWHRVVLKDGSIASRMSADLQRAVLEAEGVIFLEDSESIWLYTVGSKERGKVYKMKGWS